MIDKTTLEWTYRPADYFETAQELPVTGGTAHFDAGTAIVTLAQPTRPVPPDLQAALAGEVRAALLLRQLQVHRPHELQGPTVVHHRADGGRDIVLTVGSAVAVGGSSVQADFIVRDADGNVIHDSKADRLARDGAFLVDLMPKVARSPLLQALLESYARAGQDPADEMHHLYAIRDALAKHYHGEGAKNPWTALGVDERAEWKRLGELANEHPISQSRHPGKHLANLRPATAEELDEARRIARTLITAFARMI